MSQKWMEVYSKTIQWKKQIKTTLRPVEVAIGNGQSLISKSAIFGVGLLGQQ